MGEITASLLRLPAHKKTDRKFRVYESSVYIQMFTSLMLQLVHSCIETNNKNDVARKLIFENGEGSDDEDEIMKDTDDESQDRLLSMYENAVRCANMFSEYFLERCTKSESADGDNRIIIENFVDDLLAVLPLPSWPGADLMLQAFANVLCNKYLSQTDVQDKFRQLALKILGKIAARIKELEFKYTEFMKEYISNMGPLDEQEGDDEQSINLFISPQKEKKANESPTKDLQQQFNSLFQLDQFDKMKISLFVYLSSKSQDEQSLDFAKKFAICQWFYDEREIEKKIPFYKSLWEKDDITTPT